LTAFLVATFWDALGLGQNKIPLAIALFGAFGISIVGSVTGIRERKQIKSLKIGIAIAGHFIIVGFILILMIYAAITL
jgi:hypothetical protein